MQEDKLLQLIDSWSVILIRIKDELIKLGDDNNKYNVGDVYKTEKYKDDYASIVDIHSRLTKLFITADSMLVDIYKVKGDLKDISIPKMRTYYTNEVKRLEDTIAIIKSSMFQLNSDLKMKSEFYHQLGFDIH